MNFLADIRMLNKEFGSEKKQKTISLVYKYENFLNFYLKKNN